MTIQSPHARVAAWRASQGLSLEAAGKLVGVSQITWREWEGGRDRPRAFLRDALEIVTGIPATAWETPEERARLDALRAAVAARLCGKSSAA